MEQPFRLITRSVINDVHGEIVLYDVPAKEVFVEADVWVKTLGENFTKTTPPLPRELHCWWNSVADKTIVPGSFSDTMPPEEKPVFSRMYKTSLREWLDVNVPDYDYSGRTDGFTRNQLVAECNSAWRRLHGDEA